MICYIAEENICYNVNMITRVTCVYNHSGGVDDPDDDARARAEASGRFKANLLHKTDADAQNGRWSDAPCSCVRIYVVDTYNYYTRR